HRYVLSFPTRRSSDLQNVLKLFPQGGYTHGAGRFVNRLRETVSESTQSAHLVTAESGIFNAHRRTFRDMLSIPINVGCVLPAMLIWDYTSYLSPSALLGLEPSPRLSSGV